MILIYYKSGCYRGYNVISWMIITLSILQKQEFISDLSFLPGLFSIYLSPWEIILGAVSQPPKSPFFAIFRYTKMYPKEEIVP
jgi:hypothetical protein